MIGIESLVGALVTLLIAGLIFWLLWWLVDYVAPPQPFHKIAKVVIAIFAVLICISALLSLIGVQVVRWH